MLYIVPDSPSFLWILGKKMWMSWNRRSIMTEWISIFCFQYLLIMLQCFIFRNSNLQYPIYLLFALTYDYPSNYPNYLEFEASSDKLLNFQHHFVGDEFPPLERI